MTLSWVVQTAIILGLGIIGYFLRELKKGLENKIDSNEKHILGLEERMDLKMDAFQEEIKKNNDALEKRLAERINNTEKRYEELHKDLNDYKGQVNKDFTLKDDFIRAISGIDRKLDKIIDMFVERR
jgi:uncharacterized protein HemX